MITVLLTKMRRKEVGEGDRKKDVVVNDVNERAVENITLNIFYEPHTIFLLFFYVVVILYSFLKDESDVDKNIWHGLMYIIFCTLILSVLSFPNGPFTRPHPIVWRMVFGLSILYLMFLSFLLLQNYDTAKSVFRWLDPKLKHFHIDKDKVYGVNCNVITWETIWGHMDIFALGHFLGWVIKAILMRHAGILWYMSIMWEVTEFMFAHLLPNFIECWWDAIILDVLLCNGIGIWVGLKICKYLEMREYKWDSIKDISSTSGKLKRAILQFTPGSWTHVKWFSEVTFHRLFLVSVLVVCWQISELNTFFLKHIFEVPSNHPLVIGRLIFLGIMVAPSARQYYAFVTDPHCPRLGNHCWVYGAIMLSESLLCFKNGRELFGKTRFLNIVSWIGIMMIFSIVGVYGGFAFVQRCFHNDDGGKHKKEDSACLVEEDNNCDVKLR